jgi:hypothetical protein
MKTALIIGAVAILAKVMLEELAKREPKVFITEKLPFSYNALTVPPVGIFITRDNVNNKALLDHERIHWQQYQHMGLIGYYYRYIGGALVHGYDRHPMELQARGNESEYCQNNYTECVRSGAANTIQNKNFRTII